MTTLGRHTQEALPMQMSEAVKVVQVADADNASPNLGEGWRLLAVALFFAQKGSVFCFNRTML
jgi:hypothetical protein